MPTKKARAFQIRQKQKRRAKRRLATHSVRPDVRTANSDSFLATLGIVRKGFKGSNFPNVFLGARSHIYEPLSPKLSQLPETKGDRYEIQLLARIEQRRKYPAGAVTGGVKYAAPQQVKKLTIVCSPELTAQEFARKQAFYARAFSGIRFELVKGRFRKPDEY